MIAAQSGADDSLNPDRVDDEAEAIAAERVRSGAADETEDGIDALKRIGISFSEDGDE